MCELLVTGDFVVTCDDADRVVQDGAVAVQDGCIVAVGAAAELESLYDPVDRLHGGIVLPGLINTHGHAGMTLYRGLGDDLPLMTWLQDCIWPAEKEFTTPENVRLGTQLAVAEMLASGTTTFADMYFFEDQVGEVADETGIRALLGQAVIGFPTPDAPDTGTSFRRGEELALRFRDHPRVNVSAALHSVYTLSPEQLSAGARHASDLGIPVQIHMSETAEEVRNCVERHGVTPPALLQQTGLLRKGTICAHGVHLTDADRELLRDSGAGVSLNPDSNLKLGSGIADVPQLLATGMPLGLGTDGAASNNGLDLWHALRLTALLHKGVHEDPLAVPAPVALNLATRGGAELLGMSASVGSLSEGREADLCVLDTASAAMTPLYDPRSHLAYVATGRDVIHTVVAGRVLYRNRLHTTLDLGELRARMAELAPRIMATVRG